MRIVSFRLDDARAQKLEQMFAFYGFTNDTASVNHIALLDMLFELTNNRTNSQTVADKRREHQKDGVNIACNLRTKTRQLIRQVKEGKPFWAEQEVFYCVQWEKGKVKRQLKLVTPLVCEICSALKEKWLEDQNDLPAPEPAITPQPLYATVPNSRPEPQPTQQPQQQPKTPPNTLNCEVKNCGVHYTICLDVCRKNKPVLFWECQRANPEIAQALEYWKTTSRDKK